MDLRILFAAASSSKSTTVTSDSEEDETLHPNSPKRQCIGPSAIASSTTQCKYSKKWEKEFPWLEYDENYQGAFCKVCSKPELNLTRKWQCMGHKAIPKLEKSNTKNEGTCR